MITAFDLENNFFGREPVLKLLKKRVADLKEGYRQNLAFLGGQYVGKTAVLRRFLSDLDDENIVSIYVDLEHKNLECFLIKFAGSLLQGFARIKKIPTHDQWPILLEALQPHLPRTVDAIRKIEEQIARGKPAEAYRYIIALPEIFTIESDKFCVIVLDEFHHLDEWDIPHAFADLGKKIMMQRRCLYVVASSNEIAAQKILAEKLSLLFGNFEIIPIGPFDLQTSRDFIVHNLGKVKIGEDLKSFLTDFTGGHPLYLNLISQELLNLSALHGQSEVYIPLLAQAVENTLFNRWGVLSRHFELIINDLCQGKGQCAVSSILTTLANGKHKISEMADDLDTRQTILAQKLNRLIEMGVVVKNGHYHHFQDKLFKYWIQYVFQRRSEMISLNTENLRRGFKEELVKGIEKFKTVSKLKLSERIVDLLQCFDDEAYKLNGRKYKLPSFKNITSVELKAGSGKNFDVIKALTEEGTWVLLLEQAGLGEEDVNLLMREAKKMEQRPQRQVIVSLAELDENTKIKALQERMWIWSESELNALLNLYDKPYIV